MTIAEILVVKLGTRLSKFLLKTYLKEPGETIGDDLLDVAKGKIEDVFDRREAKHQFERIGEKIAAQLLPFFEAETLPAEVNPEAVIDQLARTLEGNVSAEFFLARDLDPTKLITELRRIRPLPMGQFAEAEVQLYERSLTEAVRYIVEVAAKLPRFEVTQVKWSLRRLALIEDVVGETARDVRTIVEWVDQQKAGSLSQQYEIDYRLAIGRNLNYLELFGADLTPESRRQALSEAYVSLTLEISAESGEDAQPMPVEAVLDGLSGGTGRLIIRGEAGSGKSTLFRWAAIQAAQAFQLSRGLRIPASFSSILDSYKGLSESPSGGPPHFRRTPWRSRVPFLVRLRDCKGGKLPPPEDFPAMIAKEIGAPPVTWVREILQSGRGLLLLDGIDEIPNLHRETVKREIEAIVAAYPENFFLGSTRPEAVPTNWLGRFGFCEARVNPMSDLDRSRFIEKWHEAVAIELARMGRSADNLTQLAEELKRQLPENPGIARLATNPLLCAMICALHRDRDQKLPESQSDLCESLCQVLLHRRERESGVDLSEFPEPYRNLKYPQKRLIVQEIAHYMVLNGESTISVERAQQKIAEALRSLAGQSENDAEIICQALVERSGMLRETRPGYLDFMHNTFKEYLAGDRFASSGDIGLLADHALDGAWQRVLLFAVATARRGFTDGLIRRLLADPTIAESAVPNRLRKASSHIRKLLALQCRAAALLVDPELEVELDRIARSMFPPRNMGDAEALAASGEMGIPFLGYRKGLKAKEAAACVRGLRLIGTQWAQAVLKDYFDERRGAVVAELCQAVNPLGLRAVQEKLLAGADLSIGIRSQISDLSPLSKLDSLKQLNLSRTRVVGIYTLACLSLLQKLNLAWTQVWDVSPLAGLNDLQELDLRATQVSDVAALSGLSKLTTLSLSGTRISDLLPIINLSNLQDLDLSDTRVSDIAPLSGLSGLRVLDLSGTPVLELSPLADLKNLQVLSLTETQVSDVSLLSGLSRLKNLQKLDLYGTQVSDISPLSGLPNLRSIRLPSGFYLDRPPSDTLFNKE